MSPEFILEMTAEEYEKEGSKFVTFPPGPKVGDMVYKSIEIGMLDWDTPGVSMKIPVTISEEGPDKGKGDKVSFGVKKGGIWKGKEIYQAITGQDMPMKPGSDGNQHPSIDPMALVGKIVVGVWQWQKGFPKGDQTQPPVYYSKLISILPAGTKPTEGDLGI